MIDFVTMKVLDLSLLTYKWFHKITARSSESLNLFYFVGWILLILWYDISRFDIHAIWINFFNVLAYTLFAFSQVSYHRAVKNMKHAVPSEMIELQIVRTIWTNWHMMMCWICVFSMPFGIFDLTFLIRNFFDMMWHATSIYYVSYGGKSVFSKIKSKIENWIDAKTPNLAPMPV